MTYPESPRALQNFRDYVNDHSELSGVELMAAFDAHNVPDTYLDHVPGTEFYRPADEWPKP